MSPPPGNPPKRVSLALVAALVGAVAISFSAIFFALSDVAPLTGAAFRAIYSLPILVVIWWVGRRRDHRPTRRRWLAVAAGLMLGIDVVLWHMSIDYIGAGLATLIANSSVLWVAFGAWVFQGERPRRTVLGAVPVVLLGVAMVSGIGQEGAFGSNPLLGAVLALLAALFYSSFILGFRASNESFAPPAGPLMEATVGALVTPLLLSLIIRPGIDFAPTFPSHGWLIAMALVAQVFGWLLIGYALPRLPAVETATIILIQPVLTMIWGSLIFNERPSPVQMFGAALVLGGVGFVAFSRGAVDSASPTSAAQDHEDEHAGRPFHN
jgi:drug/metabolite transporter (DMT)-like permease